MFRQESIALVLEKVLIARRRTTSFFFHDFKHLVKMSLGLL